MVESGADQRSAADQSVHFFTLGARHFPLWDKPQTAYPVSDGKHITTDDEPSVPAAAVGSLPLSAVRQTRRILFIPESLEGIALNASYDIEWKRRTLTL